MQNHMTRFWGIVVALLVTVALIVLATAFDFEVPFLEQLEGAASLLLLAFLDALGVERRRTTPGTPAIADDVQSRDDTPSIGL